MFTEITQKSILIQEIDEKQIQLSKRLVEVNLDLIESYLLNIRKTIDTEIYRFKNNLPPQDQLIYSLIIKHFKVKNRPISIHYPIGLCFPITHVGYDYLQLKSIHTPEWRFLLEFVNSGGVFKPLWGQISGIFYQTAIQLGSYYIDIANDTVDLNKPKVQISLMKDSEFKNINDLTEYAQINKVYCNYTLIPNFLYPNISLSFPFFKVNKNNHVHFQQSPYVTNLIHSSKGIKLIDYLKNAVLDISNEHYDTLEQFFVSVRKNPTFQPLLQRVEYAPNNPYWNVIELFSDDKRNHENYRLCKSLMKFYDFRR
jgi:hypothetical protein